MKTIRNILLAIVTVLYVTSCEDPLEKGPLGTIGGDVVWTSEPLIDAYFADLYSRARFLDDVDINQNTGDVYTLQNMGGDARLRGGGQSYTEVVGRPTATNTATRLHYWAWQYLRAVNVAILELENATGLDNSFREERLGQAYFLRAHAYFRKVERYGGVPIIMGPQDVNADPESLKVPRSTEAETYDFIAQDLDRAITLLDGKIVDASRISVWGALLLKSRAMLYAGSIAENNTLLPLPDANGLVGINPSEASRYYQLSLDAARRLLPADVGGTGESSFALRPGATVGQYRSIFNSIGGASDTETIMLRQFSGIGGIYHQTDVHLLPRAGTTHPNWGGWLNVYLDTVEAFDYKDGTSGIYLPDGVTTLRDAAAAGTFLDLETTFADRDPRLRGSIAFPPFSVNGTVAYMHDRVVDNDAADAAGVARVGPGQNHGRSAFTAIKMANENSPQTVNFAGNNPLIIYRLAEAYLNYAEAALALGDNANGLAALNAIQTRADMPNSPVLTLDAIKKERRIELMFEEHRFWDLRRWRDAVAELNTGRDKQGVDWTYDVANNTYLMRLKSGENRDRIFRDEHYYLPIPLSEIQNNDALVQNPGYGI